MRPYPGKDRYEILGKDVAELFSQQTAHRLGIARHLDHRTVASGEYTGERTHGEEHRIVPGRNNPDYALWLRDDTIGPREEHCRDLAALGTHPFLEHFARVADAIHAPENLEHFRFLGTSMPEIRTDRGRNGLCVIKQDALEFAQVVQPFL